MNGRGSRRFLLAVVLAAIVTGAMPLLLSGSMPGRALPTRDGSEAATLARAAYLGQALRFAPWDTGLWQAPWFWPAPFAQAHLAPMIGPSLLARPVPGAVEHPVRAYQFGLWFSLAGAVVAVTALGRRCGLGRRAALLAGVVYALAPASVAQWPFLERVHGPWLPLVLLAVDALLRGRRPLVALVALPALISVQVQWDAPAAVVTLVAAIVYAVVRGWSERVRAPWVALALLMVGAAMVVGIQPLRLAATAAGATGVAEGSPGIGERLGTLLGAPAGHLLPWPAAEAVGGGSYPGLPWSILALGGLLVAIRGGRRGSIAVGVAAAVGGAAAAFAPALALPQLGVPSVPAEAWVAVGSLGLALLGAGGLDAFARMMPSPVPVGLLFVLALVDLAPGRLPAVRAVLDDEERALARQLSALPAAMPWTALPAPCDAAQADPTTTARWMLVALASGRAFVDGVGHPVPAFTQDLRRECCEGLQTDCILRLRGSGIAWVVAPVGMIDDHLAIEVVWRGPTWTLGSLVLGGGGTTPLPTGDDRR